MSFESIASKHPSEGEAIAKLRQLLTTPRRQAEEFTLNTLCDLVTPRDREELAIILSELARTGLVKLVVRVMSPSKQGGVRDFPDLAQVPEVIHDWRTDTQLQVTSENLSIIYKAA